MAKRRGLDKPTKFQWFLLHRLYEGLRTPRSIYRVMTRDEDGSKARGLTAIRLALGNLKVKGYVTGGERYWDLSAAGIQFCAKVEARRAIREAAREHEAHV
jgi:hypothetical protein